MKLLVIFTLLTVVVNDFTAGYVPSTHSPAFADGDSSSSTHSSVPRGTYPTTSTRNPAFVDGDSSSSTHRSVPRGTYPTTSAHRPAPLGSYPTTLTPRPALLGTDPTSTRRPAFLGSHYRTPTHRPAPLESDRTSTYRPAPAVMDDYIGLIQETEDGPIIFIGEEVPDAIYGPPSCKLGPGVGNPICFTKCIYRGHKGGYCKGKVCTCVD